MAASPDSEFSLSAAPVDPSAGDEMDHLSEAETFELEPSPAPPEEVKNDVGESRLPSGNGPPQLRNRALSYDSQCDDPPVLDDTAPGGADLDRIVKETFNEAVRAGIIRGEKDQRRASIESLAKMLESQGQGAAPNAAQATLKPTEQSLSSNATKALPHSAVPRGAPLNDRGAASFEARSGSPFGPAHAGRIGLLRRAERERAERERRSADRQPPPRTHSNAAEQSHGRASSSQKENDDAVYDDEGSSGSDGGVDEHFTPSRSQRPSPHSSLRRTDRVEAAKQRPLSAADGERDDSSSLELSSSGKRRPATATTPGSTSSVIDVPSQPREPSSKMQSDYVPSSSQKAPRPVSADRSRSAQSGAPSTNEVCERSEVSRASPDPVPPPAMTLVVTAPSLSASVDHDRKDPSPAASTHAVASPASGEDKKSGAAGCGAPPRLSPRLIAEEESPRTVHSYCRSTTPTRSALKPSIFASASEHQRPGTMNPFLITGRESPAFTTPGNSALPSASGSVAGSVANSAAVSPSSSALRKNVTWRDTAHRALTSARSVRSKAAQELKDRGVASTADQTKEKEKDAPTSAADEIHPSPVSIEALEDSSKRSPVPLGQLPPHQDDSELMQASPPPRETALSTEAPKPQQPSAKAESAEKRTAGENEALDDPPPAPLVKKKSRLTLEDITGPPAERSPPPKFLAVPVAQPQTGSAVPPSPLRLVLPPATDAVVDPMDEVPHSASANSPYTDKALLESFKAFSDSDQGDARDPHHSVPDAPAHVTPPVALMEQSLEAPAAIEPPNDPGAVDGTLGKRQEGIDAQKAKSKSSGPAMGDSRRSSVTWVDERSGSPGDLEVHVLSSPDPTPPPAADPLSLIDGDETEASVSVKSGAVGADEAGGEEAGDSVRRAVTFSPDAAAFIHSPAKRPQRVVLGDDFDPRDDSMKPTQATPSPPPQLAFPESKVSATVGAASLESSAKSSKANSFFSQPTFHLGDTSDDEDSARARNLGKRGPPLRGDESWTSSTGMSSVAETPTGPGTYQLGDSQKSIAANDDNTAERVCGTGSKEREGAGRIAPVSSGPLSLEPPESRGSVASTNDDPTRGVSVVAAVSCKSLHFTETAASDVSDTDSDETFFLQSAGAATPVEPPPATPPEPSAESHDGVQASSAHPPEKEKSDDAATSPSGVRRESQDDGHHDETETAEGTADVGAALGPRRGRQLSTSSSASDGLDSVGLLSDSDQSDNDDGHHSGGKGQYLHAPGMTHDSMTATGGSIAAVVRDGLVRSSSSTAALLSRDSSAAYAAMAVPHIDLRSPTRSRAEQIAQHSTQAVGPQEPQPRIFTGFGGASASVEEEKTLKETDHQLEHHDTAPDGRASPPAAADDSADPTPGAPPLVAPSTPPPALRNSSDDGPVPKGDPPLDTEAVAEHPPHREEVGAGGASATEAADQTIANSDAIGAASMYSDDFDGDNGDIGQHDRKSSAVEEEQAAEPLAAAYSDDFDDDQGDDSKEHSGEHVTTENVADPAKAAVVAAVYSDDFDSGSTASTPIASAPLEPPHPGERTGGMSLDEKAAGSAAYADDFDDDDAELPALPPRDATPHIQDSGDYTTDDFSSDGDGMVENAEKDPGVVPCDDRGEGEGIEADAKHDIATRRPELFEMCCVNVVHRMARRSAATKSDFIVPAPKQPTPSTSGSKLLHAMKLKAKVKGMMAASGLKRKLLLAKLAEQKRAVKTSGDAAGDDINDDELSLSDFDESSIEAFADMFDDDDEDQPTLSAASAASAVPVPSMMRVVPTVSPYQIRLRAVRQRLTALEFQKQRSRLFASADGCAVVDHDAVAFSAMAGLVAENQQRKRSEEVEKARAAIRAHEATLAQKKSDGDGVNDAVGDDKYDSSFSSFTQVSDIPPPAASVTVGDTSDGAPDVSEIDHDQATDEHAKSPGGGTMDASHMASSRRKCVSFWDESPSDTVRRTQLHSAQAAFQVRETLDRKATRTAQYEAMLDRSGAAVLARYTALAADHDGADSRDIRLREVRRHLLQSLPSRPAAARAAARLSITSVEEDEERLHREVEARHELEREIDASMQAQRALRAAEKEREEKRRARQAAAANKPRRANWLDSSTLVLSAPIRRTVRGVDTAYASRSAITGCPHADTSSPRSRAAPRRRDPMALGVLISDTGAADKKSPSKSVDSIFKQHAAAVNVARQRSAVDRRSDAATAAARADANGGLFRVQESHPTAAVRQAFEHLL